MNGTLTQLATGHIIGGGTLTATTLTSNGVITPAAGPGGLTINGNYAQTGNGALDIPIGTAEGGSGYGELHVTGNAGLAGALNLQPSGGLFPGVNGQLLTVLTNGGSQSGTFGVVNNTSGLAFTVVYNANDVQLLITQSATGLVIPGLTPNQLVVAQNLTAAIPIATGDLANNVIGGLNVLPTTALPAALDSLSPQKLQVFRNVAFDNMDFTTGSVDDHTMRLRSDTYGGLDTSGLQVFGSSTPALLSQIEGRLLAWNPASN